MSFIALLLTQTVNALSQAALLFFLGVGLTLIFGIMRIINFAHGTLYMLGAFVGYSLVRYTGSFWIALVLAPIAVGCIGTAFELGILRRLYGRDAHAFLMVTFGLALIVGDAVRLIWGPDALAGAAAAAAVRRHLPARRAVPGLPAVSCRRRHRGRHRHLAAPRAHPPRPADPRHLAERGNGACAGREHQLSSAPACSASAADWQRSAACWRLRS